MILWKVAWIVIGIIPSTRESTEAETRSETLMLTIKASWANLVQKLNDLDYTVGPWTPGTHPFNLFKYKIVNRPLAFAAATKNCEQMSGNLLYGDADIAKYIPDLAIARKVWYSTKDTRPVTAMKDTDIQNFVDNIGTCYTVAKEDENPATSIVAQEERCDQTHGSICVKMLESYREIYTYDQDIQDMKKLAPHINTHEAALMNTLQRLLRIGNPATDVHHPVGLSQTIQLLVSLDQSLSRLNTNIPLFPEKEALLEGIYENRNAAHTTILMVVAQHLENYAKKVETLIETSHTHPKSAEEADQNAEVTEDHTETNQEFQMSLDIKLAQEDITSIKEQMYQMATQTKKHQEHIKAAEDLKEKLERTTAMTNNNRRRIKTAKTDINTLSIRLNKWIQERVGQLTSEEEEDIGDIEEEQEDHGRDRMNTTESNSTNTTNIPFKMPQAVMDFLQNEEYIWIATSITILLTIIAIINSVITCIYVKKTERRNRNIKKHLQLSPKYREEYRKEQDVETTVPLTKSRLEHVESEIQKLDQITKVLDEQVRKLNEQMEKLRPSSQAGRNKKRNKANAPPAPPRR